MAESPISLEPADGRSVAYVADLLDRADLPTADVRANPDYFYVAYRDTAPVGTGGLEGYDGVGLLRSVVVEPSLRGQGLGGAICDALEAEARNRGIETLYLLTTTVPEFFAARGFERVDREAVPEAIAGTAQFAELCPDSAVCMRRSP